jgi:hypothetical protein
LRSFFAQKIQRFFANGDWRMTHGATLLVKLNNEFFAKRHMPASFRLAKKVW